MYQCISKGDIQTKHRNACKHKQENLTVKESGTYNEIQLALLLVRACLLADALATTLVAVVWFTNPCDGMMVLAQSDM